MTTTSIYIVAALKSQPVAVVVVVVVVVDRGGQYQCYCKICIATSARMKDSTSHFSMRN